MKLLSLNAVLLILTFFSVRAQSVRETINFQGVARDTTGRSLSNASVGLRLTIFQEFGPTVYQESHQAQTNNIGIFNVRIGEGQILSGNFYNINWKSGIYQLKIELDPDGNNNYINLGSSLLSSVPYSLHSSQSDRWKNDDPIVQKGQIDEGGILENPGDGTRLIWYPRKGAFRAGSVFGSNYDHAQIGYLSASFGLNTTSAGSFSVAVGNSTKSPGQSSFASGNQTEAAGNGSIAVGNQSVAVGQNSVSMGISNLAKGDNSVATGYNNEAIGDASFAAGVQTFAMTYGSATFGTYPNVQDNSNGPTKAHVTPNDRIFQIGNGSGDQDLSNAITILRNGKVGLGNNALLPQYILDVGGRARIQHKGNSSAGIYFNTSQQTADAFVGMKQDDQVGFYLGNSWNFWVTADGHCFSKLGSLAQSDRRLKRDFADLTNSLTKITSIKGYNYYMIDPKVDQSLQTGVIAQEVEEIFPELVKTDKDGMKSVNYTGLIPHLIESVKELKAENEELKKSVKRIGSLEASLNSLIEANKTLSVKIEQSK
ncbi:tail fiber domain-containing protein [Dyadobacter pollutisoli]|uniref:Tail fiber domain-containing protein n=1 Tax=Dyadobacter pollutisoli TaxID=2910158 RepID=A0A9E8NBS7_9BACT|nr:tail fiber domain-containing protein [Dyadobacter pollutisoli]WAC13750.1 tail fiber domain-containing protein [Dyadobacter pollutisoli]